MTPMDQPAAAVTRSRRGRRLLLGVVGFLLLATLAAAGALAWPRLQPRRAPAGSTLPTATVTRSDLVSQERVSGTLGYGAPFPIVNQYSAGSGSRGIVTWLPAPGQVIAQGQTAYAVDGRPIPLLYGGQPLWRPLAVGVSGPDVQELEQNLLALGYASPFTLAADGTFTDADTAAVKRWQAALGVTQTGTVAVGDAAVVPSAVRVQAPRATLGAAMGASAPVMDVTSAARQVGVPLDASLQSLVKVGDAVTVTLPGSNRSTTGRVAAIGSVATAPSGGGGSTSPAAAPQAVVQVVISLDDPAATGSLDQAPVQVAITSQRASGVLAVPVNALLAVQEGGYALQVVGPNGRTRLVPVRTGLFDDADGLVQVTGDGIAAGTRVVVPQGL
jgi:peptidoglycan hydrolase-like protein with peptidoglycan-binding domain